MSSFEKFVNSNAFFPILVLLLVALVGALVWVIVSGKNAEKKKRERRKNIQIDQNSEIKVYSESGEEQELVEKREELEEAPSNEIKMVVELNNDDIPKEKEELVESVVIAPEVEEVVEPVVEKVITETVEPVVEEVNNPEVTETSIPLVTEEVTVETKEEVSSMDDVEIEIKEKELTDETGDTYQIPEIGTINEDNISSAEIVNIESTPLDSNLDVGEEIEIAHHELEDEGESVELPQIKGEVIDDPNDVFAFNPTSNHEINENITVEAPQEYTGEKTEIFDFPDFLGEAENDIDVEQEIINRANQYIEEIMKKTR